ncbi:MAG: DegT/DnrJ/EryC1/StrS family aminotransferase, partial [Bacteroidaceae bacterium]
ASYCGCKYCVSTANGLDALTAILVAMKHIYNWADGSEVVVSSHTFIASFQAICRAGLKPVACEVCSTTYQIDLKYAQKLINNSTVALMPVYIYGIVDNFQKISAFAEFNGLKIVTDACQAHGSCRSKNIGHAAAFSFYPGKNLGALGDGGCLVTNNIEIAKIARTFCNYGAEIKYQHTIKGINSRLDAIQAAILNIKLEYLDQENYIRNYFAAYLNKKINNEIIELPYSGKNNLLTNRHIYPIFCDKRDVLRNYLAENGIETIIHYPIPPHKQKAYKELNSTKLPVCEQLCNRELSLPLNSNLSIEQLDYMVNVINNFRP